MLIFHLGVMLEEILSITTINYLGMRNLKVYVLKAFG